MKVVVYYFLYVHRKSASKSATTNFTKENNFHEWKDFMLHNKVCLECCPRVVVPKLSGCIEVEAYVDFLPTRLLKNTSKGVGGT